MKKNKTISFVFIPIRPNFIVLFFTLIITFSISTYVWTETTNQADVFFEIFPKPNLTTFGNSIIETQDGYIMVGSIFEDSGPSTWGWVVKMGKDRKKQWEKELGKKARDSAFYAVTISNDNGIVLAGSVNAQPGGTLETSYGWIVKLRPNGSVEWDKTLRFGRVTRALHVKSTEKMSTVVVGGVRNGVDDSVFITELDSKGNILWTKHIQNGYWAHFVSPLQKGNFVISGDNWIAKLDNRGNILWEKKFMNIGPVGIIELSDGSLILGGPRHKKKQYVSLIKLMPNGMVEWDKKIESSGLCSVVDIWTTDKDKILAIGETCEIEKERIGAAIFSATGEIRSITKLLSIKNLKIKQAVPVGKDGYIVVGSGAEKYMGATAAWVFGTKIGLIKNN